VTTFGYTVMGRVLRARREDDVYPLDEITILERLARDHADIDFVVLGRTDNNLRDLGLRNVFVPYLDQESTDYDTTQSQMAYSAGFCDEMIVFLNQHSSVSLVNSIPKLDGDGFVTPLMQPQRTVAPAIIAINAWQDVDPLWNDPIYVCNDPRSTLKCRDLKYPPRAPVLAQWHGEITLKHFRFGDVRPPRLLGFEADTVAVPGHWVATHRYEYSKIELLSSILEGGR
jgi:hypothetical protein